MSRDIRFDQMFLQCIQQLGSVEDFFDTLFGFIGNKTDLFTQPQKTSAMINMFLKKRIDEFQKDKAQQAEVKRQQQATLERQKAEAEAKQQQNKYYEAEKRKIENERRAKEGLPLIPDPEEIKQQQQQRAQ